MAIATTEAAARFWRLVAATPAAGPSPSAPTLTATTTRTSARTTTSGRTRSSRRTVQVAVSSTSSPIRTASFRCGSAVVRLVSFEFDFYFSTLFILFQPPYRSRATGARRTTSLAFASTAASATKTGATWRRHCTEEEAEHFSTCFYPVSRCCCPGCSSTGYYSRRTPNNDCCCCCRRR